MVLKVGGGCIGRNAFGLINGKPSAVELGFETEWLESHTKCTANCLYEI